jgi:hypothetical protein
VRMVYEATSNYIHNRDLYKAEVKKLLDKVIMV